MARRLQVSDSRQLRNPDGHLRSLARWSAAPEEWLPATDVLESWHERFWHYKVPLDNALVISPVGTPAIRAAVAQALINAAVNVSQHLVLRRESRVACLLSPESLFSSEITIFFDDSYFRTFCPVDHSTTKAGPFTVTTAPPTIDLVSSWGLKVPDGLQDFGGYLMTEEEDGNPDATLVSHHWVFAERDFATRQTS